MAIPGSKGGADDFQGADAEYKEWYDVLQVGDKPEKVGDGRERDPVPEDTNHAALFARLQPLVASGVITVAEAKAFHNQWSSGNTPIGDVFASIDNTVQTYENEVRTDDNKWEQRGEEDRQFYEQGVAKDLDGDGLIGNPEWGVSVEQGQDLIADILDAGLPADQRRSSLYSAVRGDTSVFEGHSQAKAEFIENALEQGLNPARAKDFEWLYKTSGPQAAQDRLNEVIGEILDGEMEGEVNEGEGPVIVDDEGLDTSGALQQAADAIESGNAEAIEVAINKAAEEGQVDNEDAFIDFLGKVGDLLGKAPDAIYKILVGKTGVPIITTNAAGQIVFNNPIKGAINLAKNVFQTWSVGTVLQGAGGGGPVVGDPTGGGSQGGEGTPTEGEDTLTGGDPTGDGDDEIDDILDGDTDLDQDNDGEADPTTGEDTTTGGVDVGDPDPDNGDEVGDIIDLPDEDVGDVIDPPPEDDETGVPQDDDAIDDILDGDPAGDGEPPADDDTGVDPDAGDAGGDTGGTGGGGTGGGTGTGGEGTDDDITGVPPETETPDVSNPLDNILNLAQTISPVVNTMINMDALKDAAAETRAATERGQDINKELAERTLGNQEPFIGAGQGVIDRILAKALEGRNFSTGRDLESAIPGVTASRTNVNLPTVSTRRGDMEPVNLTDPSTSIRRLDSDNLRNLGEIAQSGLRDIPQVERVTGATPTNQETTQRLLKSARDRAAEEILQRAVVEGNVGRTLSGGTESNLAEGLARAELDVLRGVEDVNRSRDVRQLQRSGQQFAEGDTVTGRALQERGQQLQEGVAGAQVDLNARAQQFRERAAQTEADVRQRQQEFGEILSSGDFTLQQKLAFRDRLSQEDQRIFDQELQRAAFQEQTDFARDEQEFAQRNAQFQNLFGVDAEEFRRALQLDDRTFDQLAQLLTTGANTAVGSGSTAARFADQGSSLAVAQGLAGAANSTARANALTGGIGDLLNAIQNRNSTPPPATTQTTSGVNVGAAGRGGSSYLPILTSLGI